MTPEGRIKAKVKELLRAYGVYWHCPVQNGMGAPSLDFICCANGLYLGIETKAPGKKPTARQENTMAAIEAANGVTIVVDGPESLERLEFIVKKMGCTRAGS